MAMCLRALGHDCDEDEVNKVMGARPMKGAAWEEALACAQHYGCRATLTTPSTVTQLKDWTDRGVPVMIAWNPEGRDWSHASVVFDVQDGPDGRVVFVADPNIPNPEKTVREVPEDEFYHKWFEKWPNYLVRRPACAIDREVTQDGRQIMAARVASVHEAGRVPMDEAAKRVAARYLEGDLETDTEARSRKEPTKVTGPAPKKRNVVVQEMVERGWGSGSHQNRERDVARGRSRKEKHKKDPRQHIGTQGDTP